MISKIVRYFFTILAITLSSIALAETKEEAKGKLQYLLAIDRIDFYSQSLADFLENKKSPELVASLRQLRPEDFMNQKMTLEELNDVKSWQKIIYTTVKQLDPAFQGSYGDLEWNHDFFKNKLAGRFNVKRASLPAAKRDFNFKETVVSERSIPRIKGQKVLLDTERYISEKTTRAIIWDAILHDRDFDFFIGTQNDFQEDIRQSKLEIVGEIQPRAVNYNKIFLTYNQATQRYSYAINLISGEDRIKHLMAQLRLIKFTGKTFFSGGRDKVKIHGSAAQFHAEQEQLLTDLFARLPKADKVVIGQKGAIEEVIKAAGKLDVVSKNASQILPDLKLEKSRALKFENLIKNANETSAFLGDRSLPSSVMEQAYALANDPFDRAYHQFDSEQASHEFRDYLLADNQGKVQRWRVFSAIWGDEVVPIARALRRSGHNDIVYIGTAGAIASRGLKIGDVIAGDHVYTHSGRNLKFSEGKLVSNGGRTYGIGQVHTPFEETDKWLHTTAKNFDAVEVETGYLRENLGEDVRLEAYFLISDVVGSQRESLAHAAQSASKRKRGQLRLLENLFVQNGIVAPVSNYEVSPSNLALRSTYEKLKALRPSREEFSLLQVAQLALRQGIQSGAALEALLKSQPAFTRGDLTEALINVGALLMEIQPRLSANATVGVVSDVLFAGTFNPKVKTSLKIVAGDISSKDALVAKIGKVRWERLEKAASKYFDVSIVGATDPDALLAKHLRLNSADGFYRWIEGEVFKPAGFASEPDKNGQFRARLLPGVDRGYRCEAAFL